MLRSPIKWYGGKGNMINKLLKFVPRHHIYVEVFGGGASLLFAKEPSKVEVYNDIDEGLVNFFRVLRDEEKFGKFYAKVVLTPYSRAEYNYCKKTWVECEDDVEKAYRWFVVIRQSFSGNFGQGWGFSIGSSGRNMAASVSHWLSILELLPLIHERFMRVQIECLDFRKIIPYYDTEETFFYCDPPYVLSTRKKVVYNHEMMDKDHEELVDLLLNAKGMVLLSGYQNNIYKRLEENGWKRVDFETSCHAAGRTRHTKILGQGAASEKAKRVESLWMNKKLIENLPTTKNLFDIAAS